MGFGFWILILESVHRLNTHLQDCWSLDFFRESVHRPNTQDSFTRRP
jgi:hypothetical protein